MSAVNDPREPGPTPRVLSRLRERVPDGAVPAVARLRAEIQGLTPGGRRRSLEQMTFLTETTRTPTEIADVARRHRRFHAWHAEVRWHPALVSDVEIRRIDILRRFKLDGAPCILNFLHHGPFDGAFAALGHEGIDIDVVITPRAFEADSPDFLKQIQSVIEGGGSRTHDVRHGSAGIRTLLDQNRIVGLASDVKGQTEARFAHRRVRCSAGAARLAHATGTPIVVMTCSRDGTGSRPVFELSDPWQPDSFTDPLALLQALLDHHTDSVLRWPEAYDQPLDRFVPLDAG